jgi:hypothetical protein
LYTKIKHPPHEKDNTNTLVEKRRTTGTNVTKTVGRVERNHNRTTAGCYNINKKGQVDDA